MLEPLNVIWVVLTYALFITAWLRGRAGRGFRLTVPVCLSLIFLYASALTVRLSWDSDMRVTALDVGQGESVVLTCGPRSVVVDCGGSYVTHDAARSAVSFLGAGQRRHVDALILSHLHSDHVNGAEDLLAQMDVDTLYLPMSPDTDGFLTGILNTARERGTVVRRVTEDTALTVGDMELTLWAPMLDGEENENCLIVMARQDDFEVMITGDSPAAAEWLLCARNELPDTEVLVVGHHGSKTSTCGVFLEEIRPDVALISVGYNNYGHPHAEVLRRLKSCHVEIHRTDEEGNITVKAGGDRNG
jgi:competence protein ComEC